MATQQTIHKVNGIDLDVLGETVKAIEQDPELGKCQFRVSNKWISGDHNRTTITGFFGAKQEIEHEQPFEVDADEPPVLAGGDQAPNPAEHLLHALAGCITTGLVAHAAVRGIHIEQLESQLEGDIDLRGFLGLSEDVPKGFTNIRMKIKVKTDEDNLERLKRLTDFSPVLKTITEGAKVDIQLEPK
ncbi:MAG: OsmC family protein [Sedimentisphaerales bacterium]|nr:OsmC family protein [Sedimentisphaerales bacterium]